MTINLAGRHPGTQHFGPLFAFDHLRDGPMREVSRSCAELADDLVDRLPDGPELTAGLRKLLEAKDCFVRAEMLRAATAQAGTTATGGAGAAV